MVSTGWPTSRVRLVGRRAGGSSTTCGAEGLSLLPDLVEKGLEGRILDGIGQADRVPPPVVLDGERVLVVIPRPTLRGTDHLGPVEETSRFDEPFQLLGVLPIH